MWLLDANMDVHLLSVLAELGVQCDAATRRGWGMLDNGHLVSTAADAVSPIRPIPGQVVHWPPEKG